MATEVHVSCCLPVLLQGLVHQRAETNQSQSAMDNLARLASRPGVQSTLILSKVDGTVISSMGRIANMSLSDASSSTLPNTTAEDGHIGRYDPKSIFDGGEDGSMKNAQGIASLIFAFVSAAGGLAQGLDEGNDIQLLRLRTPRNETVIVPGQLSSHRAAFSLVQGY